MLKCCLKCKKDTENVDLKETKSDRPMLSSKCAVCGNKKWRFMKEQAKGLLSILGIKTPLNKIPLLGDILI